MPTTIVVGGQFGSEAKGKIVNYLAREEKRPFVVRTGGANSGHHTEFNGENIVVKQVPSAVNHAGAKLFIAAGCAINKAVLLSEITKCKIPREKLCIDPRAVIITDDDRAKESKHLTPKNGSTASGTGYAFARRIVRSDNIQLAGDVEEFKSVALVETVAPILHDAYENGEAIIVEGTQGFGLSVLHGPYYPYCTSRDVTASGFASEVGLPPKFVDDVILVIRTHPIRVAGNSGPLKDETDWNQVAEKSGAATTQLEYTSVTNKLRRVGDFDIDLVKLACQYNCPSYIAVMGIDRLMACDKEAKCLDDLSDTSREFVGMVMRETGVPVGFIGTGPNPYDLIDCR